jgi:hypothetical protein
MADNIYQRAAAVWVGRKFNLDDTQISDVDFMNYVGGYCDTCGYETLGLSFKYKGKYTERELGYYSITPGQFIEEAVEIMNELGKTWEA